MFVVVIHTIDDPQGFQVRGQDLLAQVPAGLRPHQFFPNAAVTRAVCLWEGPSLEAVRGYIDPRLAASSTQEYYEVAAGAAIGLPQATQMRAG